jgi:uncharacterized protein (PEP-CTERM system associated)
MAPRMAIDRQAAWVRTTALGRCAFAACLALGAVSTGAWAQAGSDRAFSVEPSLSIRQVVTDNFDLTSTPVSDAITELGAGLRVNSNAFGIRGTLEYQLNGLAYARHGDRNTVRHLLDARAQVELIEELASLDLQASMNEQAITVFDTLAVDSARNNSSGNRLRVYSVVASPFISGRAGGWFDYQLRLRQELTRLKETPNLGYDRTTLIVGLADEIGALGWRLGANYERNKFRDAGATDASQVSGALLYRVNEDLRLGVNAGTESTDYSAEPVRNQATYGVSAEWAPTPRTMVNFSTTRRNFGRAHNVEVRHRLERLVFTYVDTRELTTGSVLQLPSALGVLEVIGKQFAGGSVSADQAAAAGRDFLRRNSIDPDSQAIAGFTATGAAITRTQALAAFWRGIRSSVSLRVSQRQIRQIDGIQAPIVNFQVSKELRQRGLTGDASYNISPVGVISVNGIYQLNEAYDSDLESVLKSVSLAYTSRPSTRVEWSLGGRYTVSNGAVNSYRERSGFVAYRLQF